MLSFVYKGAGRPVAQRQRALLAAAGGRQDGTTAHFDVVLGTARGTKQLVVSLALADRQADSPRPAGSRGRRAGGESSTSKGC